MKKLAESHILARIVEAKKKRVRDSVFRVPEAVVRKMASTAEAVPSFQNAISQGSHPRIIAEIKKASPSAGVLTASLDVDGLARSYAQGGAVAVSVVTEEDFFSGDLGWIRAAAKSSRLPVLRKDFIFDPYQVAETRAAGASAVLLIVAMLEPAELRDLLGVCNEFRLDALVEVHDNVELAEALGAGASIVGVNNRDLKTFDVNLDTGIRLGSQVPKSVLFVAESGIHGRDDIERLLGAGADAFLIGERLIRAQDPGVALKELL
jgi:indole-3-glycerol phosphate synthase